jgi:hypothetical protein
LSALCILIVAVTGYFRDKVLFSSDLCGVEA